VRRQGGDEGDVARFREIGGRFARSRRLRPNDWTPEEVERRIWDEDVEWAYVFDSAGRQVLRKRGTADGVFFGADEVPVLRDALLIHNHPPQREYPRWDPRYEGGSFSERDLDLVLTYDIAEMRAVTSGWRYVVVRPLGGWVSDAESAVAAYSAQMKLLRAEDAFAIEAGDLTEQEADGTRAHRTLLYLAAWGRFSYRREEA
jgi:hypothetical protein